MRAKKSGLLLILVPFAVAAAVGPTLPFPEDLLQGAQGQSLKEVVEDSTLHRQMSGLRVYGEEAVFEYLWTRPDFAMSLSRAAGLLKYTLERRGETDFWLNDHKGLTADIAILRAERGRMVAYAKGRYKKGIFRIPGRIALVMRYSEGKDGDSPFVQNTVSGYVRIDAGLYEFLARLFRPAVERRMDKRVKRLLRKSNELMTRLYEDPEAVLQKLPPDTWQEEVAHLRVLLRTSRASLGHRPRPENLLGLRDGGPRQLFRCQSPLKIDRHCSRA